jgi:hypothetical protein
MTRKELQEIANLRKEIALLEQQVEDAEYTVKARHTADVVKGSDSEFPYLEKKFHVGGVSWDRHKKDVEKLKKHLQARIDELTEKVTQALEYIASIDDSRTRMILHCRYISGLTWEQTEVETGIPAPTAKRLFKMWKDFQA